MSIKALSLKELKQIYPPHKKKLSYKKRFHREVIKIAKEIATEEVKNGANLPVKLPSANIDGPGNSSVCSANLGGCNRK